MRASRKHWLLGAAVAVALAVLAAYAPALDGGFIWDDDEYVTRNPTLRSAEGLWQTWTRTGANIQYYPLVFTSFWLEYQAWQLKPFGYHLVNVILHLLNALLLWRLLRQLGVGGAGLAAALFALHPVHVESVAWVTERKNVLSGLFYLGAASAYLRFDERRSGAAPGEGGRPCGSPWPPYAAALALYLCALLSKTVTVTLPAALLVVLWWRRGTLARRDLLPVAPLFALGAAMAALTAYLEISQVGAGQEWDLSPVGRVLVAGRALWFYLGKLLFPATLVFSYPRWSIDDATWRQHLFPAAAAAALLALFLLRGRIGRGPLAAALLFAVTLAPALGFVDFYPMRYSFVADHFQYLASIGPIALLSALLASAARKPARPVRLAAAATAAALLLALPLLTRRQSAIYRDLETVWRDTLAKNPASWLAHNNLGMIFFDRGEWERAVPSFRAALALNPDYAEAHYNLALSLLRLGRNEEGLAHMRVASRLRPGISLRRQPGAGPRR